jgi:hypothetical protein
VIGIYNRFLRGFQHRIATVKKYIDRHMHDTHSRILLLLSVIYIDIFRITTPLHREHIKGGVPAVPIILCLFISMHTISFHCAC